MGGLDSRKPYPWVPISQPRDRDYKHHFPGARANPPFPMADADVEWDKFFNKCDSFVQSRLRADPTVSPANRQLIAQDARDSGNIRVLAIQMLIAVGTLQATFQDLNP